MAGLAAAVEMLSSNFQTPEPRPSYVGWDVPPVPPLPVQFQPQRKDQFLVPQQASEYLYSSSGVSHRQSFTRGTSGNQLGTIKQEDIDEHVFDNMDD